MKVLHISRSKERMVVITDEGLCMDSSKMANRERVQTTLMTNLQTRTMLVRITLVRRAYLCGFPQFTMTQNVHSEILNRQRNSEGWLCVPACRPKSAKAKDIHRSSMEERKRCGRVIYSELHRRIMLPKILLDYARERSVAVC